MILLLLERNGRASAKWWETHQPDTLRYDSFFVTDHVKMGEMRVEYCPTREMIGGDFVTKPLQGTLFNKFPADILA